MSEQSILSIICIIWNTCRQTVYWTGYSKV